MVACTGTLYNCLLLLVVRFFEAAEGSSPQLDFTAGLFVTQWDSTKDILGTLSHLFKESKEKQTSVADQGEIPQWPLAATKWEAQKGIDLEIQEMGKSVMDYFNKQLEKCLQGLAPIA